MTVTTLNEGLPDTTSSGESVHGVDERNTSDEVLPRKLMKEILQTKVYPKELMKEILQTKYIH